MTYVFYGPKYRVQLNIYDWTSEELPKHLRHARPIFSVHCLPNSCSKYTHFVAGQQLYHGTDPDQAWDAIHKLVPDLLNKCPRRLREYMLKWCLKSDAPCS